MYYVYKITNKINNKWYIGKRKHKDPYKDNYMGSGKLINLAIQKYGKDSFHKEILEIFETQDEAAALEKSLVTKESINTNMSYNMHEGGYGGFYHLNNGSQEHIERCKRGGKNSAGFSHPNCKHTQFKSGDERTKELSRKGHKKLKIMYENGLLKKDYSKISELMKTNINNMKGKIWIFRENDKMPIDKNDYAFYKQSGWLSADDKKLEKMKNMKVRWCNNGVANKLVKSKNLQHCLNRGFVLGRISSKS